MGWKIKTLYDAMGEYGLVDSAHVQCERCHCPQIPLDMMYDLRHLSKKLRNQMSNCEKYDFICDACLHTIFTLGHISHHHFYSESGAPTDVMERIWQHMQDYPYMHDSPAHKHRLQLSLERIQKQNKESK